MNLDPFNDLVQNILHRKEQFSGSRLFTVGLSGIDGAGKGYTARRLQMALEQKGLSVAHITIDPWQQPLALRLNKADPALTVYENIFRWDDFFNELIIPLQTHKSIFLVTTGIRTDADEYYPLVYDYPAPDLIILEGILLFKSGYLPFYDVKIWIQCSFETALQRALDRNTENLEPGQLFHDYEIYYHAAQRLHFRRDKPWEKADIIFNNDTPGIR